MEDDLRGVDVDNRDVAAKNLSDTDRFKRALNGELFLSVRSEERHLIADLEAVAIGKGSR